MAKEPTPSPKRQKDRMPDEVWGALMVVREALPALQYALRRCPGARHLKKGVDSLERFFASRGYISPGRPWPPPPAIDIEDMPPPPSMVQNGHHNQTCVDSAFAALPKLLQELKDLGLKNPSVKLYDDASGTLTLGSVGEVTSKQYKEACRMVKSNRRVICSDCIANTMGWPMIKKHVCLVQIDSCCGFIAYASEIGQNVS